MPNLLPDDEEPQVEIGNAEFKPFRTTSSPKGSVAPVTHPYGVPPDSGFKVSTGFWDSLIADPHIKGEFDREVDARVRKTLETQGADLRTKYLIEGREEGVRLGVEQAAGEIKILADRLSSICAEVVSSKTEIFRQHQKAIGGAMKHVLQRFRVTRSEERASAFLRWVEETMTDFQPDRIVIRVSQEEFRRLSGVIAAIHERNWQIVEDPALKDGEIHCECEEGGRIFDPNDGFKKIDEWLERYFAQENAA